MNNLAALPPLYRDSQRLVAQVENMVRCFDRYHRYTIGTDLRQQSMRVLRLVHRAFRDKANQFAQIKKLVWAIDDLKLTVQLAREINAFASFAQFEQLATLLSKIGKQCGGWLKVQSHPGQNSQGSKLSRSVPHD